MPSARSANVAYFVALLASALVLGPALAHLLELPNKIDLPRDEYFIVQKAYRGWSQIAWVLGVQVVALMAAAILARAERRVMVLTLLALACVLAAQGFFWTFTYPANAATANWTVVPDNWDCAGDGNIRTPPAPHCSSRASVCSPLPSCCEAGDTRCAATFTNSARR